MNIEELLETGIDWDDLEYQEYVVYLHGEPFTGTAIETLEGHLLSQTEFVNGFQHGISRTWSATGQLLIDENLYRGILHGTKRTWYPDGKIATKSAYDRGHCLYQISWDEDGNLLEHCEIDKLHYNYKRLKLDRERYPGWPEISEEA